MYLYGKQYIGSRGHLNSAFAKSAMLFGIICALSFSTAAGATVHAEVSARGFDLLEELDDAGEALR